MQYDKLQEIPEQLIEKPRSCANKCIFCFMDQLPDKVRHTLIFKDDDFRLSFITGNYVTLTNSGYKALDRIISQTTDTAAKLKKLLETEFDCGTLNINESLGRWIRNCINYSYDNHYGKVKVACSSPIDAYKLLFEKEDSDYFYNSNPSISMYQVYNAFTQVLTDARKKDSFNVFEKTLLVSDILGI